MKSFTIALSVLLATAPPAWTQGLRNNYFQPRLFSVTTTREIASQYSGQWNIQRQGSRRLRDEEFLEDDLVQLNVLVTDEAEAAHLDHLETAGLVSYEVNENGRHLEDVETITLRNANELSCYRTVDETFASMETLAKQYPDFVRLDKIGESWVKQAASKEEKDAGYDIPIMVISAPSNHPKHDMMIVGGHHSREMPPPELIMRWAEDLLKSYDKDADISWVLERTNFHIVPIANPDGRAIVQEHMEWMYRKNAHPNECVNGTEFEGVDLNRQYPFMWGDDTGSSPDPCASDFRGEGPLSEPESRAVYEYANQLFGDEFKRGDVNQAQANMNVSCSHEATGLFIDVHSYGDFVYFPYGYADISAPDHRSLLTMASKLAQPGNYSLWGPGQDGFLYYVAGDSTDAIYGIDCIPAFGYEIGSQFYANCTELEEDIMPIMYESLLYAAKTVSAPYKIPLGPDLTNVCVDNRDPQKTTMVAHASDEALIVGHTIFEGELSQSIQNVKVFVDVHPYDDSSEGITMEPMDGVFDSTEELATYSLDISSWKGRHVVYFQATDTDGNTGPVSAVYVDNSKPNSCWENLLEENLSNEHSGEPLEASAANSIQYWSTGLIAALIGLWM